MNSPPRAIGESPVNAALSLPLESICPQTNAALGFYQHLNSPLSSKSLQHTKMGPDRFSALPGEIRNAIYELVLPKNKKFFRVVRSNSVRPHGFFRDQQRPDPALLAVSRLTRQETSQIFFKHNEQRIISSSLSDLSAVARWLSRIIDLCGPQPFERCVKVHMCNASFEGLYGLFPLVEVAAFQGLRQDMLLLYIPGIDRSRRLEDMFEEAFGLGRQAWTDGWDIERLKDEFQRWLEEVKQMPLVQKVFCSAYNVRPT